MLWLCLLAFNIGNRTENGAYSVLAVFGQPRQRQKAKETTTLARDLCPPPHTHTRCGRVWGIWDEWVVCAVCCCCCGGAAVATFYCFCCIAKRITARCGRRQHRGCGGGGNGGLGAALFEEFMAFRDVSMYVLGERAMGRLDTKDPGTEATAAAAAFPTAKIGNLPQASKC